MLGNNIKKQFPIFKHHPQLVYLDSAATALKPQCVLDAISDYYTKYSANIHRGIYSLSEKATQEYEDARAEIAKFLNADPEEIVFVKNATEGINLVAHVWARRNLKEACTIGLSIAEHHSNIVPWQQLVKEKNGELVYLDVDDNGELSPLLSKEGVGGGLPKKIDFLALAHVSNVLGTINPIKEIISQAKKQNVPVLIDAAQSAPHIPIDVKELDCDFLVFSGHKLGGPTGIGVLYIKKETAHAVEPFITGGSMIREVTKNESTWNTMPWKLEAGTPHIAGAIGLAAAVRFVKDIGLDNIKNHEEKLLKLLVDGLRNNSLQLPLEARGREENSSIRSSDDSNEVFIFGPEESEKRSSCVSFTVKGVHPHDIAQVLDEDTIAVRAGHHCAMPLHTYLNISATARASVWVYNTEEDIAKFLQSLERAVKKFI
ncbi:MAG: SufS family cysteine desulfurase [Candidatus Jacksonbacteria bacterium]|jgi:cysteine desulfurase / selenocysteine lyase|nr:SufS family cysteine desulfurase [Candidatus Jacksonbacteria bacterium]MBT6301326.1 SufS family cysteine desulfurase [Candidatus Jacksonbacteria bacterium]